MGLCRNNSLDILSLIIKTAITSWTQYANGLRNWNTFTAIPTLGVTGDCHRTGSIFVSLFPFVLLPLLPVMLLASPTVFQPFMGSSKPHCASKILIMSTSWFHDEKGQLLLIFVSSGSSTDLKCSYQLTNIYLLNELSYIKQVNICKSLIEQLTQSAKWMFISQSQPSHLAWSSLSYFIPHHPSLILIISCT